MPMQQALNADRGVADPRGKDLAAIVPIEDLELLGSPEDRPIGERLSVVKEAEDVPIK